MRTAVIVGAGIGGVAAAVALQQRGWRVTVLERAQQLGEVGAGLSIWPSAAAVLRQLGVKGVEPGAHAPGVWGLRTASGRWIVQGTALGAQAPVMIHRAKLHDRITDQFGPGITVRTGFTVTGVDQDDSGATVRGAGEQLRADLVVAADGIRSTVRSALHPQYPSPQYPGYTSYRGLADVDTVDGGGETWGHGRRFGFARLDDGRIYWYATANQPARQICRPSRSQGSVRHLARTDSRDPGRDDAAAADRHPRPGPAAGSVRHGSRGAAGRRRARDDPQPRPGRLLSDRGRRRPRQAPGRHEFPGLGAACLRPGTTASHNPVTEDLAQSGLSQSQAA